jgi:hypothetical protein
MSSEIENNQGILENLEKTIEDNINSRPQEDFVDDEHRDLELA